MPASALHRYRHGPVAGLLLALLGSLPGVARADPLSDGRFRDEVAGIVRAVDPSAALVPDPDPMQIRVGTLTIALTNLYPRVAGLSGAERRRAIESYVAASLRPAPAPTASDAQSFAAAKPRLRVQLVPRAVLQQTPELVHRAFSDTLIVTYVLDEPARYRYVTRDMLARWSVDAALVEATALANLKDASRNANFQLAVADGTPVLAMTSAGDDYDAARLMLPDYLAQIADALKTDALTVAVPTRDLLMAWPADSSARRGFADEVRRQMRSGAYARSDELFHFAGGALRPLTPAERADHGR